MKVNVGALEEKEEPALERSFVAKRERYGGTVAKGQVSGEATPKR